MSINVWSVPSNDGWNSVTFDAQVLHHDTNQLEHSIELKGQFWYRPELSVEPPKFDRLVDDFMIVLPSVLIPQSACQGLLNEFDRWLNSHEPFTATLTSTPGQVVMIQIGKRNDLITTHDHPALTFFYEARGCRLEVCFVIDQSCIRKARDELSVVLNSV
jgi:hypothetical protein